MKIKTVEDFQIALDNGPYTFPGGYPMFFICHDGGVLSFEAATQEQEQIKQAITDKDLRSEWHIVACEVNWEDTELTCEHTGKRIESAYGE